MGASGETNLNSVTAEVDAIVMRAQVRVGRTLRNKWRLDALLGVGGMAAVYGATHRNRTRAAVKILHPERMLDDDVRNRFLREGYLANSVGHPGCVKVLDDDVTEDGTLFLVTELLDGETLEARRLRYCGRVHEQELLTIVDQTLDVLIAAHEKGIVHRDIKPENIFVTRDGRVKVLDFGMARLKESVINSATRSGVTMGTPVFMAPEQARGLWDEVDGLTDLWAVGASMFHCLTGRFVHDGRTVQELLLGAMTQKAPLVESIAPQVNPKIAHVVDTALRFDRKRRWADARAMQAAVREAYEDNFQNAIATAPALSVPATVPDRTVASGTHSHVAVAGSQDVLPGTTTKPVQSDRPGSTGRYVSRGWMAVSVAGASVVGIAIAVGVFGSKSGSPPTPASTAGPSAPMAASQSPTPVVSASTLQTTAPSATGPVVPESAAPHLAASAGMGSPKPAAKPRPTATGNAPPRAATRSKPPCPVDPVTGKVRYTEECL